MINHLGDLLLPTIEHVYLAGYWVAFFAALLETTIGIGLLLPGSTVILFLGALSARGYLDPAGLIWFAILGAVLGDNLNYWLGKKYGARWIAGGFWFLKSSHIDRSRRFMDAHGAKSVFLGRFVPSVKEVVPFIAGSVGMKRGVFLLWNILGATGWGLAWVLAGHFFARSLNLAELWLSRAGLFFAFVVTIGVILFLCKWLVIRYGRNFWNIVVSLSHSVTGALANNEHVALWVNNHPRVIFFLRSRVDTKKFSGLPLTIFLVAFLYVFALFAGIIEDLLTSDPIVAADVRIASLLVAFRTETLTSVFTWLTLLGKGPLILVLIGVLVSLLWLWRKQQCILPLLVSVLGSELFTYLGKLAFHRARPEQAIYVEHSYSFPSGHATVAVAFYGFIGYLLVRFAPSWKRKVNLIFLTIVVILAIGLSRIYLGVHYISDVWSGFLVGALWLIIAVSLVEWADYRAGVTNVARPRRWARPASLALLCLAILAYWGASVKFQPIPAQLTEIAPTEVGNSLAVFVDEQAKYSESILGEKQEPVNFIFLARDDAHLAAALRKAGWVEADSASFGSFIKAFDALIFGKPNPGAPISPSFWNARIQRMGFVRPASTDPPRNPVQLRVWRSIYSLDNGNRIYIGMARASKGFKWGVIPRIAPDLNSAREGLYRDLDRSAEIETDSKVHLVAPGIGKSITGDRFFSDGDAYIVTVN